MQTKKGRIWYRKVQDLCQAASLKMICRLFTTDSLWSSWMRRKYLQNRCFWDTSVHLLDSGTLKLMTGLKNYAIECMRKVIGNGHDTLLWFDPWLNEGRE